MDASSPDSASSPFSVPYANSDAVCVLAYATLMLNTCLWNPNARENMKMSPPQFVAMNRGINAGKNLESRLLDTIYASIKEEEIKVQHLFQCDD